MINTTDNAKASNEDGNGEKLTATSTEGTHVSGSPSSLIMTTAAMPSERTSCGHPREDNRPPPPLYTPVTTAPEHGHGCAAPSDVHETRSPITTTADENGHGNTSSNNDEMSIVTLEPWIPVTRGRSGRGGRSKHNNNPRNNIITSYPLLSNKGPTLKKFFVIKALNPNTENLWSTIDTIKANQDLKKSLGGNPRNVSELRNGTILVETENQIQSNKIMQLKTLARFYLTFTIKKNVFYLLIWKKLKLKLGKSK